MGGSVHKNHVRAVVTALNQIANVRKVWRFGFMHRGGPHRRLAGGAFPISIGEDECAVFGALIAKLRPRNAFIIGNAFGLSAAYIALAMREIQADHVVAMDAETEGDGKHNAGVARELAKRLQLDLLHIKKGFSPQDVPAAVEAEHYDLIFIDGNHDAPYPKQDLNAMLRYVNERTVVVFHDYFVEGVRQGVDAAASAGLQCLWVPTSCEMVLATRSDARMAELRALFPEGAGVPKPTKKRRKQDTLSFWMTRGLPLKVSVLLERLARTEPVR